MIRGPSNDRQRVMAHHSGTVHDVAGCKPMKRMIVPACLALVGLIAPRLATAQDVAITNARVIVGSGQVIESGTIIVRGGKIVSVTAVAAPTQGLRTID